MCKKRTLNTKLL